MSIKITGFLVFQFALILSLVFLCSIEDAEAQDGGFPRWVYMMQDPDANFFETVKEFENYWKDREIEKGSGYKPFRRWQSYMEPRVDEYGNRPPIDQEVKALEYLRAEGLLASSSGNWTELGPIQLPTRNTPWQQANGLGRVNVIAFHPTDSNKLYVGAPSGGFWQSADGGKSWTSNTDTLPSLGVSAIVVAKTAPQVIYIGTGDRDAGNAAGLGVMKSEDGGISWRFSKNGMGNTTVGRLIIHPQNDSIILAASSGGIYKSSDAGDNWTRVSSSSSHFKDIRFKPSNPTIVYATENGNFYRSTNTGDSWSQVSNGITTSNISRIVIGTTVADPNYLYLLVSSGSTFGGLYRSVNSGVSFTLMSDTPNILDYSYLGSGTRGQAWYDLCIAVDPVDRNTVYAGGINIFKSTNGGQNWLINGHWVGGSSNGNSPRVHADQHALEFSPVSGKLYSGNDGGLYVTDNGGIIWDDISSGLAIGQVYRIGQSGLSKDLVACGYQDNGTGMFKHGSWSTVLGADGMECEIDYSDTNYVYATTQNGNIYRSTSNGSGLRNIVGGISESGAWITPFALDNRNPDIMYAGMENLWRSRNIRNSTTSGINWSDLTNHSNSTKITHLAQSYADPDLLYYSRGSSDFYRTDNLSANNPTFSDITNSLPRTGSIRDIQTNHSDSSKVYIIQSNRVFMSSDKGLSWTDLTANLPTTSFNCLVLDTTKTEALYLGTDLGVYYWETGMLNWVFFGVGLPLSIEVSELEIYYDKQATQSSIRAGTYGRGLWQSDLFTPPMTAPIANFIMSDTLVCSGFPVTLKDSSLNIPNAWMWNIDPPTFTYLAGSDSSSPNPRLVFNAVGNYNVKLVVSNPYGQDSILKTGSIRVFTGSPGPLVEDFEGMIMFNQSKDDDIDWTLNSGSTPSATTGPSSDHTPNGAYYMYTEASGSNNNSLAIIESNCLNTSQLKKPFVKFWYHMSGLNMGQLSLDIDTSGGQWHQIWSISGDQGNQWQADSVDLSGLSTSELKIRFRGKTGSNYQSDIAIDDIEVYDGTLIEDLRSVGMIVANSCEPARIIPVRMVVENVGQTVLTGFSVAYRIQGQSTVRETYTGTLNPGQRTTYTFIKSADFIGSGAQRIEGFTEYINDVNSSNDTSSRSVNIYPKPSVSVQPPYSYIKLGDTAVITASGADTYTWIPGLFLIDSTLSEIKSFPPSNDTLLVVGQTNAGCRDSSQAIIIVQGLGMMPAQTSTFQIYPNPAKEKLIIYSGSVTEALRIIISDGLGRKVLMTEFSSLNSEREIDISRLKDGVYFIELYSLSQKLILRQKFIKSP